MLFQQMILRLLTQWSKWLNVTVCDTLFVQMFQSLGAIYTHRNLIPTSFALSQSISLRVFYFPECGWCGELIRSRQTPALSVHAKHPQRELRVWKRGKGVHEEIDKPVFRVIVLECSLQTAFHLSRADWEDHRSP